MILCLKILRLPEVSTLRNQMVPCGKKNRRRSEELANVHKYLRICDLCKELGISSNQLPFEGVSLLVQFLIALKEEIIAL
jgi:hypothetical protein